VRKVDNLPPSCTVVTKSGNLNFLEPFGPVQAYKGTALPLPFTFTSCMYVMPASEVRESNSITTDSTAKLFLWPPHAPLIKTIKIIYPFITSGICSGHS